MWDRRRETRDMRQEMWDRDVRQETWDRREVAGTFSKKFFLCPFLFFYCPVSFCAHPFLLCSDFLYNFWCYVVISLLPATPSPPLPEPFAISVMFLCPPLPFFAQIYHIWILWLYCLLLAALPPPSPLAESFATRVPFLCPPLPVFAQIYNIWWLSRSLLATLPPHPPAAGVICHQCHFFVPTPSSLRSDLSYLMLRYIRLSDAIFLMARIVFPV